LLALLPNISPSSLLTSYCSPLTAHKIALPSLMIVEGQGIHISLVRGMIVTWHNYDK
jgi:hypothetical protein